jgi:hypothetical protein
MTVERSGKPITAGAARMSRAVLLALLAVAVVGLVVTEVQVVYDFQGWSGERTDFYATVWEPNRHVLDGRSAYDLEHAFSAVYPPSGFLPLLPLSWFDPQIAVIVFQLMLLAAAALTMWALRVRDPRMWALWITSPLVLLPVLGGNITPVVVLAVALMWRWRDRAKLAGVALAAGVAVKLFVAPLAVWLLLTRRYVAAAVSAAASVAMILVSWALIGFDSLADYPTILDRASDVWGPDGPYVQGLAQQLGLGGTAALAVGILVAVVLFAVASRVGETPALAMCCLACLALSPVAWVFYAGILVVPLAAARLPWTWWLVLLGFWVSWWHSPLPYKSVWLSTATIAVALGMVLLCSDARRPGARRSPA